MTMMLSKNRHSSPSFLNFRLLHICVLVCFCLTVAQAKRKQLEPKENENNDDDIPGVHFLVDMIGKEIYQSVNTPKYKFYIYMTIGKLPDEESTVALLSIVCNILYGVSVFFGFLFLPRSYMLIITLLTLYVGPAMILILLGCVGVAIAAFAMYPVLSVLSLWIFFFLTSHLAQALGRYLGLDSDKDGDVDFLDLLHYLSNTRVGKFVGLGKVYHVFNDATQDPLQRINARLDEMAKTMNEQSSRTLNTTHAKKAS